MLKQRLAFVFVTVLATGVWFWLYTGNFLVSVDTRLQDKLLMPRSPAEEIVLVTIDNASIQELGVWPFSRSLHAKVLEIIAAGNPKVIGYDVTFSEASTSAEDQILAEALTDIDNVVLASEAVLEIRQDDVPMAVSTLEPLLLFRAADVKVGATTLVPDGDGVIREAPTVFERRDGEIDQTFAAVIAEIAQGGIEAPRSGLLRVAYVGGPQSFTSVSFADVLAGEIDPGVFADKIVLVGSTAPDLHDEYLTPFGSGQPTPGVEIQANIIQSLMEGRNLQLLTEMQIGLLFAIIGLLGIVAGLLLPLRYLTLTALVSLIGYLLVAVGMAGGDILLPVLHPLMLMGAIGGIDVLYRFRDEYARRAFIQKAFSRYVSPAVVEKLASGEAPLALGGSKEELTILFSDIRGFTTLSEKLAPEQLVKFLNEYLTGMTDIVLDHEGTVDKYIGDAVMAFWGAPLPQSDHALRGVSTAMAMKKSLAALNARWKKLKQPTIEIGIGLNTGRVIVGNMGSERRFDYTVIGDDVNLASRLESLTKYYGVSILVSEATKLQLGGEYLTRLLDKVAVKGKKEAVKIYEVIAAAGEATEAEQDFATQFETALEIYYSRDWKKAEKLFAQFTDDKTAQIFIDRCRQYAADEPGEEWDGTFVAKEK